MTSLLKKNRIQVWGGEPGPVLEEMYRTREWNSVFIQFSYKSAVERDSFMILNGEIFPFETKGGETDKDSLWIGARPIGYPVNAVIAGLQVYEQRGSIQKNFLSPGKFTNP